MFTPQKLSLLIKNLKARIQDPKLQFNWNLGKAIRAKSIRISTIIMRDATKWSSREFTKHVEEIDDLEQLVHEKRYDGNTPLQVNLKESKFWIQQTKKYLDLLKARTG